MASDSSRPANGNGSELLRKEIKPSVEFEIEGWDERKCIDILIVICQAEKYNTNPWHSVKPRVLPYTLPHCHETRRRRDHRTDSC